LKFFLEIIELYGDERLNNLKFEIVDIDKRVTDYHKSLFSGPACANVSCLTTDITSFNPRKDAFLYFNFCGIGESLANVRKYLHSLPDECSFMISWSNSRRAQKNTAKVLKYLNSELTGRNLVLLESPRKDFVTYFLQPPPAGPVVSSPSPPPAGVPPKTKNNDQPTLPKQNRPLIDTITNLKQNIGKEKMKGLRVLIRDGKWKDYEGVFKSWSGTVAYVNLSFGPIALRIKTTLQVFQ